ncbi:MAG: hypothetical protein ACYC4Q_12440, partial [Victivallaceae bacterium]
RLYLPFPVTYDVNSKFKSGNGVLPDSWVINKNDAYKPYGNVAMIDRNERKAAKITSAKAPTMFYCRTLHPVNGGDTVTVEFDASGNKGAAIAGINLFSDYLGNCCVGGRQQSFELPKEMKRCKFTFKIPEQINGKQICAYRMLIIAPPSTELIFANPSTGIVRDQR